MSFVEAVRATQGQLTYGVEAITPKVRAASLDVPLVLSKEPTLPLPEKEYEEVWGNHADRAPLWVTTNRKWALNGSIPYRVQDGDFIAAILGSSSSGAGPPYTHTMTKGTLPWFSMAYAWDLSTDLLAEFLGCKVNKATFSCSAEEQPLLCEAEIMACVPQEGSAIETFSYSATKPYTFKTGVLSSTSLYTGAKARFHDFKLTVDNQIEAQYADEYYPYDLVEGGQKYELTAKVGVEDNTELTEVIDDTDKSYDYSLLFTRGTDDTLAITGNASLPKVPYDLSGNSLMAELFFVPVSCQIAVVDATVAYTFD